MIKLMYAFLWQQEFFTGDGIATLTTCVEANIAGGTYMPKINALANKLSGHQYKNPNVQACEGVYTQDVTCRNEGLDYFVMESTKIDAEIPGGYYFTPVAPHAKWHEEAANGLFDLYNLALNLKIGLGGLKDCKEGQVNKKTGLCKTNTGPQKKGKLVADITKLALKIKKHAEEFAELLQEFYAAIANSNCWDDAAGEHRRLKDISEKAESMAELKKYIDAVIKVVSLSGAFVCDDACPTCEQTGECLPGLGLDEQPPKQSRRELLFASSANPTCCIADLVES